jgi:DNA modification methylase
MKENYLLKCGDCSEKLKEIDSDSIDLVLTDPPYNLGLFMKKRETNLGALRSNHFAASDWDHMEQSEWEEKLNVFFEESARIIKTKGALIVFVAIIKAETVINIAQKHGFYYKTTGIWHKTNPMPRNMNLHFINSTESWIYFINDGRTGTFNNNGKAIHDFYESGGIGMGEKKDGKHPTQKPIALMEHFVKLLSNEGDTILDPFMGGGSSGIAAVKNNRKFRGIELSKEYFKMSSLRIKKAEDMKK